ncbi:MAG: GNAT family N-acetyltransferase [Ferruginibacter sp.]
MQQQYDTERLLLNTLTIHDTDFIFELVNTESWKRFIGDRHIHDKATAAAYVQKLVDNKNIVYWVASLKEEQVPVGVITLIKRDYLRHHDIGFAFLPGHSKKGYAFEAAAAVVNDIANDHNHTHLLATTLESNTNSISLLERLGLSFSEKILNNGEELLLFEATSDQLQVNRLIQTFFSIFNNVNGRQPGWDLAHSCFIKEAIIIKKTGVKETIDSVDSFITPRKAILSGGSLIDFSERELNFATNITGNIAQRSSRYQKTGRRDGVDFKEYGNKLFQFIKTGEGWKISSLLWEDDAE